MINLKNTFRFFIFLLLIQADLAYEDIDESELERLEYLADNIRCPKCSYGNISSSNAPYPKGKKEIVSLLPIAVRQKFSDELQDRYGDYILLDTILKIMVNFSILNDFSYIHIACNHLYY